MAVTDPIADYLTRIRNAQIAGHRVVDIPASQTKKRITEILYDQGYIMKYTFVFLHMSNFQKIHEHLWTSNLVFYLRAFEIRNKHNSLWD